MSVEVTEKQHSGSGWLEHAVFRLDRWLRQRNGIFEYSAEQRCLFRLERACADQAMALADGTRIRAGDPILKLHLWNEHVPAMGQQGPTVAWARQVSRAIEASLRELARYWAQHPELDDVQLICGEMHLGTAQQCAQLARILARYGFEALAESASGCSPALRRLGDQILIFMLILVTNPVALRNTIVRRYRTRIVLSRVTLARRYAGTRTMRAGAVLLARVDALRS